MPTANLVTQNRKHALSERGLDSYETPECAVHGLLGVEQLPRRVWECACGPGAIVSVLRAVGHDVVASDVFDYGCPDSTTADFLTTTAAPPGCEAIVTNPPFRAINEFIEHGLGLVPRLIMLARLALLESERRARLFDGGHLTRVHVFRSRLPMMHRKNWQGPRTTSSAIAYAWFVFDACPSGQPTVLDWI
jgi:hypothetical protein